MFLITDDKHADCGRDKTVAVDGECLKECCREAIGTVSRRNSVSTCHRIND